MCAAKVRSFQREIAGTFPPVDLYETKDDLVLEIDLPGVAPEDVLIKVYDDLVIIEGIRRQQHEEEGFRYLCMERSFESFRRLIRVPIPVDFTGGKAFYSNGVVTIVFPKLQSTVMKIRIKIES